MRLFRRLQDELGNFILYPGETTDNVFNLDYQIKHEQYNDVNEHITVILYSGDNQLCRSEYQIADYLNIDRLKQLGLR